MLELINENPKITRGELSEKIGINPSAIQRYIQKLKTDGVIKQISSLNKYFENIQHFLTICGDYFSHVLKIEK